MKILCSGYLVRYPLGGLTWHHLQYLIGLRRLGHEVTFFEDYGWQNSCYDPARDLLSADPSYGIAYLERLMAHYEMADAWCYIAEDGTTYGLSRERLAQLCRECDLYINLSNINWIPELEQCRRRLLVDTDPVFTQIGAHGLGGPFSRYDVLFTYGENVHKSSSSMPTASRNWLPTRQPIVLDLWPVERGKKSAPFTTVMNWSPLGDCVYGGRIYGQKEREFETFFSLPRYSQNRMEVAARVSETIYGRLIQNSWQVVDPLEVTRDTSTYKDYLAASFAEFSVAKHGYVTTRCGWFSERTAAYLALGRPAAIQDTGFSDWLQTGAGVVAFGTFDEAVSAIDEINRRYEFHCRAAREIAEEYFDASKVLSSMIEDAMNGSVAGSDQTSIHV